MRNAPTLSLAALLLVAATSAGLRAATIGVGAPIRGGTVRITINIGSLVYNPVEIGVLVPPGTSAAAKTVLIKQALDQAFTSNGFSACTSPTPTSVDTGSGKIIDVNAGTTGEVDTVTGATVIGAASWIFDCFPATSFNLSGTNGQGQEARYVAGFKIKDPVHGDVAITSDLAFSDLPSNQLSDLLVAQYSDLQGKIALQVPSLAGMLSLDLPHHMISLDYPSTNIGGSLTFGTTDMSATATGRLVPVAVPEPATAGLLAGICLTGVSRRRSR